MISVHALTPWSGMWNGNTSVETWDADMARAASLNINTVRTFLQWYDDPALIKPDGTPTQTYLDRFEQFLEVAWKHGIRVILCGDHWWRQPESVWRNTIRGFVEPHRLDGRVLMWEPENEPDLDKAASLINGSIPLIRSIDPYHLITLQLDTTKDRQVNKHGLKQFPDIATYHDYYSHKVLWEKGIDAVTVHIRETIKWNDGKPLFLGEFGTGCIGDGSPEAPSNEDEQASLYGLKLHAVEDENALGAANWALVSWANAGSTDDKTWGTFRQDYTLRPAGELLKQCYARWARPQKYLHYDECHSTKEWKTFINCKIDDPHPDDSLIRQTINEDGSAMAACEPFQADVSKALRFEVAINNMTKGAIVGASLVTDSGDHTVVASIDNISTPGLYSCAIQPKALPRSGSAVYWINLSLRGSACAYTTWDRVAIIERP